MSKAHYFRLPISSFSAAGYIDSKPHFELLDGLRGVAALMVIIFHIGEAYATSPLDQWCNHGYLAVDFFFILSGFVIGYAYDTRWQNGMTKRQFALRRFIRLHPLVVLGTVLGAITFCVQGCVKWDGTPVDWWQVGIALVLGACMLPMLPGTWGEVRGNNEMFPLNGPAWSLFFEYIANLLYLFILHRLSTRTLGVLTAVWAVLLGSFALCNGSGFCHLGVGWSLTELNLPGGLLRMLFAFSMGLLLIRVFRPLPIRGAFWLCSIALIVLMAMPYVGGADHMRLNGLYDTVCVVLVFPLLVYLGASGSTTDNRSAHICRFLGDISYPVYILHYPFMYLFYAWVWDNNVPLSEAWPVAVALVVGVIVLAYIVLWVYDLPIRRVLRRRLRPNPRRMSSKWGKTPSRF